MSRHDAFMTALEAAYAGPGQWFARPEDAYRSQNWDRIVAYPVEGDIKIPAEAAQGWVLSERRGPSEFGAVDNIIWQRFPTMRLEIWAADYTRAENRLHAMLIALARVAGQTDIEVSNPHEQWVRANTNDITGGGCMVILTFGLVIDVIESDEAVVGTEEDMDPVPIGAGQGTEVIESIEVTAKQEKPDGTDYETVASFTIEPEET